MQYLLQTFPSIAKYESTAKIISILSKYCKKYCKISKAFQKVLQIFKSIAKIIAKFKSVAKIIVIFCAAEFF